VKDEWVPVEAERVSEADRQQQMSVLKQVAKDTQPHLP